MQKRQTIDTACVENNFCILIGIIPLTEQLVIVKDSEPVDIWVVCSTCRLVSTPA